jgi:hypothetical protein
MSERQRVLSKQVGRLHVAVWDLHEALQCATALRELRSASLLQLGIHAAGLELGAVMGSIICYCRPFVPSNSNGIANRAEDPAEAALFEQRPDLAELHDHLLALRNKAVAHSDWTQRASVTRDGGFKQMRMLQIVDVRSLVSDTDGFIQLIEHVKDALTDRLLRLENEGAGFNRLPNIQ